MLLMEYPPTRGKEILDYSKTSAWNILHAYIDAHIQRLIYECPGDGIQYISRFKSQFANMTFTDQIRHNIMFQQVMPQRRGFRNQLYNFFRMLRIWKFQW